MAQTYYDILGVSPTADDFVIRAAYKALAQRYHPDKFQGNAKEAEQKMRDINEAYDVLSDENKRRAYDASFKNSEQNEPKNEQAAKQQEDWAIALRFYPDLTDIESRLNKIDPVLVPEFRSSLLASQQYERRQAVASQIEQQYLEDYFGNDKLVVDFARELLLAGKRDGAKELNRMMKVVGGGVSAAKIIEQIEAEYLPQRKADREEQERIRKEKMKAERELKKQQTDEKVKRDAVILRRVLIVALMLLPIVVFMFLKQAEKSRLEAERVAEERRVLAEAKRAEGIKAAEVRQAEERKQAEDLRKAEILRAKATIVIDATGLEWKRCSEGQTWNNYNCSGSIQAYTWNDAMKLTSNVADKTDWRLPTLYELKSLYRQSSYEGIPTINTELFPNTFLGGYWTSTISESKNFVKIFRFDFGYESQESKSSTIAVRLVRDIKR